MDNNTFMQRRNLELSIVHSYPDVAKDILMVVKDGLDFVKPCIESVLKNTDNFTLYLWDNGSKPETADYLQSLVCDNVVLARCKENVGFVVPNNRLAELGTSPYIILLNSDTKVERGWDRAMTSLLQLMPKVGAVGYSGGIVNEQCIGVEAGSGHDIDFVQGYCMAFSRETYTKFGLFDEANIRFAYGEDSDFCFRLREAGMLLYALSLDHVWHKGGATSFTIFEDVRAYFNANHNYLRRRYKDFLLNHRHQIKRAKQQAEAKV